MITSNYHGYQICKPLERERDFIISSSSHTQAHGCRVDCAAPLPQTKPPPSSLDPYLN